jgi:hypothetical protein
MYSDMVTVAQAARKCPILSEAAIRSLIRRADKNGLSGAVRRIGGRIYLIESAFHSWLNHSHSHLKENSQG